ncbi:hypothetical protein MLD38_038630 [Melastoma candidum]|uniref:Uncharacterized protein n=1 Tax=Melastoma candidum TaxID=119954 RepID=A0ACB9KZU8_9MYRT|nr:hypothetical protein MLD38_038630 [Melastoma candidum]
MDRLFGFVDDWDLQAVVRGCAPAEQPDVCGFTDGFDLFEGFPSLERIPSILDDWEELFGPFDADLGPGMAGANIEDVVKCEMEVTRELEEGLDGASGMGPSVASFVDSQEGRKERRRRRRNHHKNVVHHVTAEGVSADMWAWRKYGQKPIKGSPYPRSYYKCSSSKGCPARKQVDRSSSEPGIFILTYTGEHTHTHPTRRNPLAGIPRRPCPSRPSSPRPSLDNTTPSTKTRSPSASETNFYSTGFG